MKKSQLRTLINEIVKLVCEDPDLMVMDTPQGQVRLYYTSEHDTKAVLFYWKINDTPTYFAYSPLKHFIFCSDPGIEEGIEEYFINNKTNYVNQGRTDSHGSIKQDLIPALGSLGIYYDYQTDRIAQGRLFGYGETYGCSFWEDFDDLKPIRSLIRQSIEAVGIDPDKVLYEPSDYTGDPLQAWEFYHETNKEKTSTGAEAAERERLHLDPEFKKKMLHLPPDRLKLAADKLGMTTIQLKQMLGRDIAETSIIKEASSTAGAFWWMDPDAKLHKVPRFGHWDWAKIFLKSRGIQVEDDKIYTTMASLHWYRVTFTEYGGKTTIEYDNPKKYPMDRRQVQAVKDLAIEQHADEVTPVTWG